MRVLRQVEDLAASLARLLWPPACACCDVLGEEPFCASCAGTLLPAPAGCPLCGTPGVEYVHLSWRPRRCAACRAQAPPFWRARAPYLHGGALADAIHRLKYGGRADLARSLGVLFAGCEVPEADVVAPIPLHPGRVRERGYDQADLIAQAAARQFGLPLRRLLHRARATSPQVGLQRTERLHNVRGSFRAEVAARDLGICLIDDVLTTGATAAEAARSLLQAGARRVEVRTLARAP